MSNVESVAEAALRLSEAERARVAMVIMDSLPPEAWEADDVLAEAERRDAEMESGTVQEISHEQFVAGVRRLSAEP
jgi:putative addiction module component (TIGR02574 family)